MTERFFDILDKGSREYGDRIALADASGEITYSGLKDKAGTYARKLDTIGIRPGDIVGLCGYDSIDLVAMLFAIVKTGAVAALISFSMPESEMASLIKNNGIQYVFYGKLKMLESDACAVDRVISESGIRPDHMLPIERVDSFEPADEFPDVSDPYGFSVILFTSGTTSAPKGCMQTEHSLLFCAASAQNYLENLCNIGVCICSPVYHLLGLDHLLIGLMFGNTVCLPEKKKSDVILSFINKYRSGLIVGVPTVLLSLIENKDFTKTASHCVRGFFSGGGALAPVQIQKLETACDNAVCLNGYGSSEAGVISFTTYKSPLEIRLHSIGPVVPGKQVAILDSNGKELPSSEMGEICIKKSDTMMLGYLGKTDEETFDPNGWFHSGDLGYADENGNIFLSGRIKDLIIKGGENVAPSEIETAILSLDKVSLCKVLGAPHRIYGETVEACVVLKPGKKATEEELLNSLKGKISRFKTPERILFFDAFPLNPNGKINVKELKVKALTLLRRFNIEHRLDSGLLLGNLHIANMRSCITPVAVFTAELVKNLGIKGGAGKIQLFTEELLTERILNTDVDPGAIDLRLELFRDFLRIRLEDHGELYNLEKRIRDNNLSARIIYGCVDDAQYIREKDVNTFLADFRYDTNYEAIISSLSEERSDFAE